jgi:hemerythrin-like domain-containing protein
MDASRGPGREIGLARRVTRAGGARIDVAAEGADMTNIKEFTEIGRRLHEEHQSTLSILNDLEAAILARPQDHPMDLADARERETLERFIRVVDRDVSRHFDFEEDALFPILRSRGAADMADMLTREHAAIKPIAIRLKAVAAHALKHGFNALTWGEFRTSVIDLMDREAFHIQKEEMGLVRVLAYFLDDAQDAALAKRYDTE